MSANNITIDGTEYDILPLQWQAEHGPRAQTLKTLPVAEFRVVHRVYGQERAAEPQRYRATWDMMERELSDVLVTLYEQQVSFALEFTDTMGRTVDAAPTRDLTGAYTEYFAPTFPFKSGTVSVYKDDALQGAGFSLQNARGSVVFDSPLGGGNVVTVKYDWQLAAVRLEMLRVAPLETAVVSEVEAIFAEVV